MPSINRPTLLLDRNKLNSNIEMMSRKAKSHSLLFRPHFKTHQSALIADSFKDHGVHTATVSSLSMANYFIQNGWTDLTVAIPHNPLETPLLNTFPVGLSIGLLVDHPETVLHLDKNVSRLQTIWIKIDTGAQRCGVVWNDEENLSLLAATIKRSARLKLTGLLTHAGHSYAAKNKEAVLAVHKDQIERMNFSSRFLESLGCSDLTLSIGDTPSCRLAHDFKDIDEIRPGNFVFFDVDQLNRHVCGWGEIAVVVVCPIIGVYPKRRQMVIHGGAVHLSKEFRPLKDGIHSFGLPVLLDQHSWSAPLNANLTSLSQEHGVIQFFDSSFSSFKVGDSIGILPIHSCLTADLHRHYMDMDGILLPKRRSGD